MTPPPNRAERLASWFWRRPHRWFLLGIPIGGLCALIVGVFLTGGFLASLKFAETNTFCTACHEMNTAFGEYALGAHYSNELGIRAGCANCHVPPTLVAGLVRHAEASFELWGHLTGELDTPAKYESHRLALAQKVWTELKANNSAECRSCHSPAAMALEKQPSSGASAHRGLATSGSTCIDCHKGIAHTLPKQG